MVKGSEKIHTEGALREERIKCPECGGTCNAVIKLPTYFHICEYCSEIITASEWERVDGE
jgi:hypothetical protein